MLSKQALISVTNILQPWALKHNMLFIMWRFILILTSQVPKRAPVLAACQRCGVATLRYHACAPAQMICSTGSCAPLSLDSLHHTELPQS